MLFLPYLFVFTGCARQALDNIPTELGTAQIRVLDNEFMPRVTQVAAGTPVTWEWERSSTTHDVSGEGFQSEVQREGTFAYTFPTPGIFDYRCRLHSGMVGRVIVTGG